jgi:hypothetical protein
VQGSKIAASDCAAGKKRRAQGEAKSREAETVMLSVIDWEKINNKGRTVKEGATTRKSNIVLDHHASRKTRRGYEGRRDVWFCVIVKAIMDASIRSPRAAIGRTAGAHCYCSGMLPLVAVQAEQNFAISCGQNSDKSDDCCLRVGM